MIIDLRGSMNKGTKIGLGVIAVMVIAIGALYVDFEMGKRADIEACLTLQPSQAANAVIKDVVRADNQIFAKYHLSVSDLHVDMAAVQIGPMSALVPFHISTHPAKQYFGMPRCSALSNVEYSND
ncbi:hypothetical protein [Rahnella aceris]|uniref:Uncharacterized protein n=1 Tax=Rahnella sp. (strain Y9602) TaxID=2703885 RepID=A0ABW6C5M2_RAHSY